VKSTRCCKSVDIQTVTAALSGSQSKPPALPEVTHSNAWFAERLVSLRDHWSAFNAPPDRASFKQQLLFD